MAQRFLLLDIRTLFRHFDKKPMSLLTPKSFAEIGKNGRLKKYPNGSFELLVCDRPIFGFNSWEELNRSERRASLCASDESDAPSESGFNRSIRRARQHIKDYALCNDFKFFVTLTLDPKKVDRYNIREIVKSLNVWLDNRVRRYGLKYILVPELHKDGAIHFHGFFNDALKVVESKVYSESKKIYNLPSWTYGFSTAIELYGEYEKAVSYVCKYVGKSCEKIGGRWYYSGGELLTPEVSFVDIEDDCWESKDGARFDICEARLSFICFRGVEGNAAISAPTSDSPTIADSAENWLRCWVSGYHEK